MSLHFSLFRHFQGVIDLDTQVANCALQLGMSEEQLNCPQIAGPPVDQRRLGSAQRMCAKTQWVELNELDPIGHQACILTGRQMAIFAPAARKEIAATILPAVIEVGVYGLPSLLGDLEANGTASLSLAHRRTLDRIAVFRNGL